jgi:hypothetical protein
MVQPDEHRETQKLEAIRTVLRESIPVELIDDLGLYYRATAHALLAGDDRAVRSIDERAEALSLAGKLTDLSATDSRWTIDYTLSLRQPAGPVTLHGDGEDTWRLDESALPAEYQDRSDPARALVGYEPEVLLVSRRTGVQWHLPSDDAVRLTSFDAADPSAVALTIQGRAVLDPMTAASGSPLTSGIWDVVIRAEVLGVELATRLTGSAELEMPGALGAATTSARAFLTTNRQTFAVEVTRTRRSPKGTTQAAGT